MNQIADHGFANSYGWNTDKMDFDHDPNENLWWLDFYKNQAESGLDHAAREELLDMQMKSLMNQGKSEMEIYPEDLEDKDLTGV